MWAPRDNPRTDLRDEVPAPARRAPAPEPVAPPPPAPRINTPRGFFCSASPTAPGAAFCTRIKSDCLRMRGVALGAVVDLSECALTETAYCFDADAGTEDHHCAPTKESCELQQNAAPAGNVGACDAAQ